jgi:endonuclease/exonuclease/phosphatase family metal-dependent hydrolase
LRSASRPLRLVVAALVAASLLLTGAQQLGSDGPWWLELSRYLPFPIFLAAPVLALLFSLRLGWRWLLASAAALVLMMWLSMGFAWRGMVEEGGANLGRGAAGAGVPAVRVMTWNVKAGNAQMRAGGVDALAAEVARQHPDVLVMQDAHPMLRGRAPGAQTPIFGLPELFLAGQFIVASRLPLRDCAERRVDAGIEGPLPFVQCTVEAPGFSFQLVTTHFESPRSGLNAARREGFEGIESWRRNHAARLAQARALAAALAGSARPLVVAGDLNAPEASAVIQSLLAIGLRDAFSSAGLGWGYTYGQTLRPGFSFLRIDHVLVSPTLAVQDAFAGGADASEHRPVIVDLAPRAP